MESNEKMIGYLISQVTEQIVKQNKTNTGDSKVNSTAIKSSSPFSFSFRTKHKQNIIFPDAKLADRYLSLPASQYSILNSTLIKRSLQQDDSFTLSIPLGDFSYAVSANSPTGGPLIDATLMADVLVKPQPDHCKILMESGNIMFLPSNTSVKDKFMNQKRSFNSYNSYSVEEEEINIPDNLTISDSFTPTKPAPLPNWLVWGGSTTASTSNIKTDKSSDHTNTANSNTLDLLSSSSYSGDVIKTTPVKSSLQIKFKVELDWPRHFHNTKTKQTTKTSFWKNIIPFRNNNIENENSIEIERNNNTDILITTTTPTPTVTTNINNLKDTDSNVQLSLQQSSSVKNIQQQHDSLLITELRNLGLIEDYSIKTKGNEVEINTNISSISINNNNNININNTNYSINRFDSFNEKTVYQLPVRPLIVNMSTIRSLQNNKHVHPITAHATITVWVEGNIPIRSDIQKALSFHPVKLLFEKSGQLVATAIMKAVAPTLSDLLVLDYVNRAVKTYTSTIDRNLENET